MPTGVKLALLQRKRATFSGRSPAYYPNWYLQVDTVMRGRQEIGVRADDSHNTRTQKMLPSEQHFPDRETATSCSG